ncbi:MAG TPA: glycosyltransferase family 2 protein [Dongiaceae bacterium]|nr:glycosyltransferase family 2 protein [Dongiaceae bacterium]
MTILLPVHNRPGPLVEAVQSCVDQTWRPIEILVIDDGSVDDLRSALSPFGEQVRLIHKMNGGVASARNLGLRMAQGDFIHFLDSDDLLAPTAIENNVAAFAVVADADLCYGQSQWIDMRTVPPQMKDRHLRALQNPVRSMIVEFAFPVPTVMMPRWRMLAMPPFEEDLRRSSDWRYWQGLGFAQAKAVGIRTQTAYLRRFEHSLQATPHPHDDSHAVAVLRGLRDLIRHPHAWLYAVEYMNLLIGRRSQHWFAAAPSDRIKRVLAELTAALRSGSIASGDGDLSMLPMLAAMRGRIQQLKRQGHWSGEDPACAYDVLFAAISRAIGHAASISGRDIAFWTREPDAPIRHRGLQGFFASVERRSPPGGAPALADALLRASRRVPRRRFVRMAARLQSILGARLAGRATAHWMRWSSG